MGNVLRIIGWILFLWPIGQTATASHIAGGNIELVAADKPGQFRLSLNLYIDDASRAADAVIDTKITVSVFRIRDNQLMSDYTLPLVRKLVLVYANPACARTRGLQTSEIRYSALVQLDPARFDDPAGYYVVWEKCCRNQNVVNIKNPEISGMIYYLSFAPLVRNGSAFRNSSPVFLTPNAEYICVNKPFSLAFRATDADGDELRYSLVTPYNDNIYKPYGFSNSPNSPAYRQLQWMPGFDAQQPITGNPALSIGGSSGVLTVKPDRLGLFAFTVLCEEYRNGVKLGEVRRDHQILVVDCAAKTPPKPLLSAIDPTGQSPLQFCEGNTVRLQTNTDSAFNYQWQRDGYNLPGETKPILRTQEPGDYTVVKSFALVCTRDSVSDTFKLTLKPSPKAVITAPDSVFCPTRPLLLTASQQPDFQYQWSTGTADIAGATNPVYTVIQSGIYRLKIYNRTTDCTTLDSIKVKNGPLQRVTLTTKTGQSLCEGVPLTASTEPDTTRLQYSWLRNGVAVAIANANKAQLSRASVGDYTVTVSDTTRCAITSAVVHVNPRTQPLLDSLPPFCGPTAASVALTGTPVGGSFSGAGVSQNRFDPAVAGVGQHRVRYVFTNSFGCPADTSRLLTVLALPVVNLGPDQRIPTGRTLRFDGPVGSGLTYRWEPDLPASLSAGPTLTIRPDHTTTYRLTVLTGGACPVSDDVLVDVLPGLFIPTAFSPNGDGLNDTWVLPGADAFPKCSVRIYDRWGEVIFQASPYSQPWDGLYKGQPVGAGAYQYIIRSAPDQPEQQGTLIVF